jgi:8-oxo-dGTP diphosphatase
VSGVRPPMPPGPRDKGDAWVYAADGQKYWGRYGAAGLLVWHRERGVLLQHRVGWSHFGGTWGLPGGALKEGETAEAGALREAHEEAGVPSAVLRVIATSVLNLEIWSYTTVIVEALEFFEPVMGDAESEALEWIPVDSVENFPLHPGFGLAWAQLRSQLR